MRRIDVRTAGFGIEAKEYILVHIRFTFDETNRPVGTLEKPEIAVTSDIDKAFERTSTAAKVHDYWRRYLIPIPGIIGMILKVPLDLSCSDIECDRRCGVQVVAGALIADPRTAVAGAEVGDIGLGVVVARHPHGAAAGLPLIAVFWPRL